MMSESILEALFNGRVDPLENFAPTLPAYKQAFEQWHNDELRFMETLNDEQQAAFERLMEDHLSLRPKELSQSFIDGFRLAVKMMAEIYAKS